MRALVLGVLNPKSTMEGWTGFHTVYGDIFEAQRTVVEWRCELGFIRR